MKMPDEGLEMQTRMVEPDYKAVAASLRACRDPQKRYAADVIDELARKLNAALADLAIATSDANDFAAALPAAEERGNSSGGAAKPSSGYICMDCDGCGWCEGSPAWTCRKCNGTGQVPNSFGLCSDCPRTNASTCCAPCPHRSEPLAGMHGQHDPRHKGE